MAEISSYNKRVINEFINASPGNAQLYQNMIAMGNKPVQALNLAKKAISEYYTAEARGISGTMQKANQALAQANKLIAAGDLAGAEKILQGANQAMRSTMSGAAPSDVTPGQTPQQPPMIPMQQLSTTTTTAPTPQGPTLARDTFKKTLALMFGQEALTAGWVDELYGVVSGFYKTGSSIDESLNLALRDVRENPNLKAFTNRFRGIFALEDRLRKGEAVYVPTIAEYTGIQQKMAENLTSVGLADLATLDFTSDLIGRGLSATESANRINNVFMAIDNAPDELKKSFGEYFPMVTRSDLAKSLLLGEQGARELEQKVAGISVKSAAVQQGLVASDPFNLARAGVTYSQALRGYGQIAQFMPTAQKLSDIQGGTFTMPEAEAAIFGTAGSAAAQQELQTLGKKEQAMFSGRSGIGETAFGTSNVAGAL